MDTKDPKEIQKHETFKNLFPVNEELLGRIEENMRESQDDYSQPIILATWKGQKEPVCIDGHTRLQAAIAADIESVPVFTHEFNTEDEALEKSILLQTNRRNMTDAELIKCMEILDNRRKRGGDRRSEDAVSKPKDCGIEDSRSASAKETGEKLRISPRKVEQIRTVMDHADQETVEEGKNGEISINKAYQETQDRRKKGKKSTDSPKSGKSKKKKSESRKVEIDAHQWEQLKEKAESMDADIADLVYEALEEYLEEDDSTDDYPGEW